MELATRDRRGLPWATAISGAGRLPAAPKSRKVRPIDRVEGIINSEPL